MLKKFVKIVLWIGIGFGLLLTIAYIVLRLKYPPDEIIKILTAEAETALNRRVTIGSLWLNPVKGFTLGDVCVYDVPRGDSVRAHSARLLSVERVQLRYRLLSLLRKQIQIHEIIVDRPEAFLFQNEHGIWNFESMVPVDSTKRVGPGAVASKDSTSEFSLPFSVKLKKFAVNDMAAHIGIHQPPTRLSIKSGGLSVHLDDFSTSLKSLDEMSRQTKASLSLSSDDQPWEVTIRADSSNAIIEAASLVRVNLKTEVAGAERISATGEIALTDTRVSFRENDSSRVSTHQFPLPELMSVSLALLADIEQQSLEVNDVTATLGDETLFSLGGSVTRFIDQPRISLEVIRSHIRLKNVMDSFAAILPDTIRKELDKITVSGVASLLGTKFVGEPMSDDVNAGLHYDVNVAIRNLSAAYSEPMAELHRLNVTTSAQGILNAFGFVGTDVNLSLNADSFYVKVDTLEYGFGNLETNVIARLDPEFFPVSVNASASLKNFFNTTLNLLAHFSSFDGLNSYLADAHLYFQGMSLAAVTESALEGEAGLDLKLSSQSLDSIDMALVVSTDILEIPYEPEPIIVHPMEMVATAVLSADTTFQYFQAGKIDIQVGDFLSALAHGRAFIGETQRIHLVMDQIELDHQNALLAAPEAFLVGLETLTLSGATLINSTVTVLVDEKGEPTIHGAGTISMDGGLLWPASFLRIGSIKNQIQFETDAISGEIHMQGKVDDLMVDGVLDTPLRDIALTLTGHAPDFETLVLDSADVVVPAFNANLRVTGRADSLTGNLQARLASLLTLDATEKEVQLPEQISVTGALSQGAEVNLKQNIAAIDGWLKFDNVSVQYDTIARADTIAGCLYFTQKIDIEKGWIVQTEGDRAFLASATSSYYDLLRPYYFKELNDTIFSRIHINKISAMDYSVSDMNIDLHIQNEMVEIPRFSLKLYDGNMAGMLTLNAHTGEPENIEWKIKADLSRLNSARLLPSTRRSEKDADLNLNLELHGLGVDPATRLDVAGYLYVTKIGPQFTDNVLQSLDPKGIDKSIQDTRTLLNWGYKPRLISFEIKHDNLYPSIHLVKGKLLTKLIPLNLAGGNKIELARIPIKFFLANVAATAE
ncbi:MAG: AsmA family protein [Candidatus Zhuqueibacterota bacterium]